MLCFTSFLENIVLASRQIAVTARPHVALQIHNLGKIILGTILSALKKV